jgi:hypothetical protein
MYITIKMKMMLSFYQCYHILIAAKKGLNVGNIIYEHQQFFPAKVIPLKRAVTRDVIWRGADYGKCLTLRNFKKSAIICPIIKW